MNIKYYILVLTAFAYFQSFAKIINNQSNPTYVCGIKGVYQKIEGESISYYSNLNFELSCNQQKVEFKNEAGEKWLVWLTNPKPDENSTLQFLNLKPKKSKENFQVVSKLGYPDVGIRINEDLAIDCHIKI